MPVGHLYIELVYDRISVGRSLDSPRFGQEICGVY